MEPTKEDVTIFVKYRITRLLTDAKRDYQISTALDPRERSVATAIDDLANAIWKEIEASKLQREMMPPPQTPVVTPKPSPSPSHGGSGSGSKRPRVSSTSSPRGSPSVSPSTKKKRSDIFIHEPTSPSRKPNIEKKVDAPFPPRGDDSSDKRDPTPPCDSLPDYDDSTANETPTFPLHSPVKPSPATPTLIPDVALEEIRAPKKSSILLSAKGNRGIIFTLSNDADAPIAFKIDGPNFLTISPINGIIKSKADLRITLRLNRTEFPEIIPHGDILSVEWRLTPEENEGQYEAIWFYEEGLICKKNIPVMYA